jgi:hypothetical protein
MLDPLPVCRKANEKSHPWPEKAPNGIHAAAINGRVGLRCRTKLFQIIAQTSSAARELFRHARIHVRAGLCLSVASLVNATPAPFLCAKAQMTRSAD